MAIGFRGSVTEEGASNNLTLDLTALTGGSGSAALANDVVYVLSVRATGTNDDVTMSTSGYAELADLYANDTADTNLGLFRKVMGGTPDTSAVTSSPGNSGHGAAAIAMVFSGVDTTTPEDVTSVTVTGTNGSLSDPGAITPTTAGAWIVGFYGSATEGTTTSGPTAPSGLTNWVSATATAGTLRRGQAGAGTKTDWASGAFDPAAWSGTVNANTDSRAAVTVALRPAAGGTTVSFDSLAYTQTLNAITIAVNTPVSLDSLAYTQTLNAIGVAVNTPVALDSLSYTQTLNDLSIGANIAVALDSLSYTQTLNAVGVAVNTPVGLDSLAYSVTLNDITAAMPVNVALDSINYTQTINDLGVTVTTGEVRQPGGWLPIKYLDRKGRVVDLDEVKETVEEAVEEATEETPEPVQKQAVAVSDRVMSALVQGMAPRRDDVRALRQLLAEYQDALAALNRAVLAQQLLDDEIAVLLLAS